MHFSFSTRFDGLLPNRLRQFSSFMLAAALFLTTFLAAPTTADAAPAKAKYAIMAIDANTGKVLRSVNGDTPRYPASLTKMMTLYMVFDRIESGRAKFGSWVPVSKNAAGAPPSKLSLKAGSRIKLDDAVKALVTKSANDVAVAIAEFLEGSEYKFARAMTRKARSLGMTRTTFKNASGLPNANQKTTARDMLTLAMRLQDDFPQHYRLFRTKSFTYRGKTYRSHNTLLRNFKGTDGIKTGYTRASGFNLVSSVRRGEKHVVAAVFGGKTARVRNTQMRGLLNGALAKASRKKTRKRPQLIARPAPAARPRPLAAKRPTRPTVRPRVKIAKVRAVTPPDLVVRNRPSAFSTRVAPGVPKSDFGVGLPARFATGSVSRPANQAPAAYAPPSRGETIIAKASRRFAPPVRTNRAGQPPTRAAALRGNVPAPIGRTPSTFQNQVAQLGHDAHATPRRARTPNRGVNYQYARLKGPAVPAQRRKASNNRSGNYAVQVGAFATTEEAGRQLTQVLQRSEGLLTGYQPRTRQAAKGNRNIYRAQFAGFQSDAASQTCHALRRRSIDCFVTVDR